MTANRFPVLVTGGAGYIGSHACRALAQAGYTPVAVDDLRRGHAWAVQWGPLETVDVCDGSALDRVFRRHAPIAVLHFAAYINVGESLADPLSYHRNNLGGLMALTAAMRSHRVHHLVFSSTAAVYGIPQYSPLDEDHPRQPINPYGASKLASERVITDLEHAGTLQAARLRYFNAAGAVADACIGEAHDPETHLVPLAIRAALDPDFTLSVFGTDYPTRDGTAVRDYIHVTDLADAHVRALDYLRTHEGGLTLNLGTGQGYTVGEVVAACERLLGHPVKREIAARRPGDPPELVAEASRAQRTLAWQPRASTLDTIVRSAARWHQTHGFG